MSSKVLFINQGYGFLSDSLIKCLRKAGFETVHAEPDIKEIEECKKNADMVLMLAGDYIFIASDVLVYIKDITRDEERPLCVIGYDEEINEIEKFIPDNYIRLVFKRPFDAKYIAEELKPLAEVEEDKKLGKHILLVDDDPTFLKMLQGWLSDKYRVTAVKSGMQAITYLASHKPNLILLDYDMPITEGPQIMEMIRSEFSSKEVPIIFLTGKSDRNSIMKVMRLKPQGYLLKTMPRDDIVATIDDYFEEHKWDTNM